MKVVLGSLLFAFCGSLAFGAEVVGETGGQARCQPFTAKSELRVFKDPTLFLPSLSLILADPKVGWYRLMQENPLRAVLQGSTSLRILGEPREFKNFGVIARLYELAEPRLRLSDVKQVKPGTSEKIVPVQICGDGGLGFVLESDLKRAALDEEPHGEGLPPSVLPNPVPAWKGGAATPAAQGERW